VVAAAAAAAAAVDMLEDTDAAHMREAVGRIGAAGLLGEVMDIAHIAVAEGADSFQHMEVEEGILTERMLGEAAMGQEQRETEAAGRTSGLAAPDRGVEDNG